MGGWGGGPGGPDPPFLCHDVGFLTLGPKWGPLLDPLFFAWRPKISKILDPPGSCNQYILMKIHGKKLVEKVQLCVSIFCRFAVLLISFTVSLLGVGAVTSFLGSQSPSGFI